MEDKPSLFQVGFMTYEYIGSEICKEFDEKGHFVPLVNEDDVKVGDHIYFSGWNCWYEAVVSEDVLGEFTATTLGGKLLTTLYFKKDDRNCWTSFVIISRAAIDKLSKYIVKE